MISSRAVPWLNSRRRSAASRPPGLARRVCTDGRLDDLRDAGFNPFGSIARAAGAILSALPPGPGRLVAPPGAATSEAVLAAGMGCLLAFGLSCWATGALSTWQRTGRWDPTAPLPMALVGAAVAVYGDREHQHGK